MVSIYQLTDVSERLLVDPGKIAKHPTGIFSLLGQGDLCFNGHCLHDEPSAVLGDYQAQLWLTNAGQVKLGQVVNFEKFLWGAFSKLVQSAVLRKQKKRALFFNCLLVATTSCYLFSYIYYSIQPHTSAHLQRVISVNFCFNPILSILIGFAKILTIIA